MAKYQREVMSRRGVVDIVNDIGIDVTISTEKVVEGITVIDGHFRSPHAFLFPDQMPGPVGWAHFRAFFPRQAAPMCIHLAGTGDHSYVRRDIGLVKDLLKHGIGAILVQNPFYGDRKPPNQFRSSLENVSDLFVMGGALISECNLLINWAQQRGHGPFCISGISMGGFMASLAATNALQPVSVVPILSWTTASPAYTRGAIAPAVKFQKLQAQLEDRSYVEKLKRIPNVDWIEQMHELSAKTGDTLAVSLMCVLMDHFTCLSNYPTPLDTSLCHAIVAENDQYVLRTGAPHFEDVWPGMTVEVIPGVGHITGYFLKHSNFRQRIAQLLERQIRSEGSAPPQEIISK
ncbi:unnamed protein product [Caenorhabditis auriculariae]|uniref:Uncharacterized protein n=1 Tax=Caenorhabditis auriculariae TaxID=2777116 RepID=A0A8S1GNU7_9PELO|nr:unnamed protein product [Caenorhabditis auriculariae]